MSCPTIKKLPGSCRNTKYEMQSKPVPYSQISTIADWTYQVYPVSQHSHAGCDQCSSPADVFT